MYDLRSCFVIVWSLIFKSNDCLNCNLFIFRANALKYSQLTTEETSPLYEKHWTFLNSHHRIPRYNYTVRFRFFLLIFLTFGFSLQNLLSIVASILHLGNVTFVNDDGGYSCVQKEHVVRTVANVSAMSSIQFDFASFLWLLILCCFDCLAIRLTLNSRSKTLALNKWKEFRGLLSTKPKAYTLFFGARTVYIFAT